MTTIYTIDQIKECLKSINLISCIEQGFIAYSNKEVVVPPVGELVFNDPPGETHIKYGFLKGGDTYVVKIASGFYANPTQGLPSSSGLMLVFSQETGFLKTILLDEGYLTDVRTAVAGCIAAKHLASENISTIGVIGTGIQAKMQVEYLHTVTACKRVTVWGRTPAHVINYKDEMTARGYEIEIAASPSIVAQKANLIITATPSRTPLLYRKDIQPGTHITAMGSDSPGKQELEPAILEHADLVVADSLGQCRKRGEISTALATGMLNENSVLELGQIIQSPALSPRKKEAITVVDLTGVAVQDIQIASAVCNILDSACP